MITTKKIKSKTRKYSRKYSRIIQRGGEIRSPAVITKHPKTSFRNKIKAATGYVGGKVKTLGRISLGATYAAAQLPLAMAAAPLYFTYKLSKPAGKYIVKKVQALDERITQIRAARKAKRDAIARAVAEVQTAPVV